MKKIGIFFLLVCIAACKQKSKDKKDSETFFPVLSYIKSQVAHVDTSLYPIIKVTWIDSSHTDTTYIRREDFGGLAKDFLEIPDITDKKYKDLYSEEKFYDEGLNTIIFTYTPKDPDKAILQRQEVLVDHNAYGDKVKQFIINLSLTNRDSSVEKKLLWQVDKSFQVVSLVQKPGESETTKMIKVIWNEDDEQ